MFNTQAVFAHVAVRHYIELISTICVSMNPLSMLHHLMMQPRGHNIVCPAGCVMVFHFIGLKMMSRG